ncbi:tRNA adenosine(34) deaminase TadA [Catenuloplanes sp. NPDC051500]|uniref:tRNA adenosine(34) deaminase TadA n=1 Tax=Catenuloplanes sp. NPDC051500 TaxID=3363959 RepID=UPI0037891EC4
METRRERHERWMRRALAVATTAGDDVPVGAVIFGPDGAELALGRNERELTGDPTAHAEVLALRRAAAVVGEWRLSGCTLVVTLEPCTMCAGALVLARVETVVFGAWEPKTGAVGSLWDVVRDRRLNHRPEVYGGVLEPECAALLHDFFGGDSGDGPSHPPPALVRP